MQKKAKKDCHIYQMLKTNAKKRRVSFHTPGHKRTKWDITELSYSDNLAAPSGCIQHAEKDIAKILGASKSFLLTDGSTAGIFSMLYAAKAQGVNTLLILGAAHKSVQNACVILGIVPLFAAQKAQNGIPLPFFSQVLVEEYQNEFSACECVLVTSPDYYGNIPDLAEIARICKSANKLFLIDGAHGGHLHFHRDLYAGTYADLWVDGVHKSLPALTQGAVVSAKTDALAEKLYEGVNVFRTTSPSYPIMASVEYAVKYPQNKKLERFATEFEKSSERIYFGGDWTKLCARFGAHAFKVQSRLEKEGIFPEFCNGNVILFYLSPATKLHKFRALKRKLLRLFAEYPLNENTLQNDVQQIPAPLVSTKTTEKEWVDLEKSAGRICAADCGLFPPCTPLIRAGERVAKENIDLLKKAANVYGVKDGRILVLKTESEE